MDYYSIFAAAFQASTMLDPDDEVKQDADECSVALSGLGIK